jgi:hypothetical protein
MLLLEGGRGRESKDHGLHDGMFGASLPLEGLGRFDNEEELGLVEDLSADLGGIAAGFTDDFRVGYRDGAWVGAGIRYSAYKAEAKAVDARFFCDLHDFKRSNYFTLELCTPDVARALATWWRHRMQWLFDLWVASGEGAAPPGWVDDALVDYVEPPEAAFCDFHANSHARSRAEGIRALVPA